MDNEVDLKGQWIGRMIGTNKGLVTLNIDNDRPNEGRLLIIDEDQSNPAFYAEVGFSNNGKGAFSGKINFHQYPIYNSDNVPRIGEIKLLSNNNKLTGDWVTDIGTQGSFHLENYISDQVSPPTHEFGWGEFKEWVANKDFKKRPCIYRGHKRHSYKLRTSFHREGRADLLRYHQENIPELVRNLGAITGKLYNISNDFEYGGLLNLAQHHGYATPLLDWTESPYIAAFFAFNGDLSSEEQYDVDEKIRIYEFDYIQWSADNQRDLRPVIDHPFPDITTLKLPSLDNPRAISQQSVVLLSNVVDIDEHISLHEKQNNAQYIKRIDIPISDRSKALNEMRLMGITCATMFPGLDGICKELREKHFRI